MVETNSSVRETMKIRGLAAAGCIFALVLAGCTSAPAETTVNGSVVDTESPAVPDVAGPVAPEAPQDDMPVGDAPPASVGPDNGGANAAPTAQQADTFFAWWGYEVQTFEDAARPLAGVLVDGQSVCYARSQSANIDAIMQMIRRDQGYTDLDSSSLYKTALTGLCPIYDYGYKTPFDKRVDAMMSRLQGVVTFEETPPFYEYGNYMKENCAYLQKYGNSGYYAHMVSMTSLGLITNYGPVQELAHRLLMLRATTEGCYNLNGQLPYTVVMSQKEADEVIAGQRGTR